MNNNKQQTDQVSNKGIKVPCTVKEIDLTKLSKNELLSKCANNGIKRCKSKNKKELVILLQNKLLQNNTSNSQVKTIETIKTIVSIETDKNVYSEKLLKEQFILQKSYVEGRINTTIKIGVKVRLPGIPEDISENIIKFIIHNKLNDKTSKWNCKKGDLESQTEGKQECKCFTSNGPLSFTPSSNWDVIYFLDTRGWLKNSIILYRIPLKRTSLEWKSIKVSKTQTFEDQTKQGRRPRISWNALYPQIKLYCTKVYEGTFDNIFNPPEVKV